MQPHYSSVSRFSTLGSQSRRLRSTAQSLIFSKLRQVCVVRIFMPHLPKCSFHRQNDAPMFASHMVAWRIRSTQWSDARAISMQPTRLRLRNAMSRDTYRDEWKYSGSLFRWGRRRCSLGIAQDTETCAEHSRKPQSDNDSVRGIFCQRTRQCS